jgi:hypothetical protein
MMDWAKRKNLSNFIRSHKEYFEVCSECKDEVLLYPTISGRTTLLSQAEIEYKALRKIMQI